MRVPAASDSTRALLNDCRISSRSPLLFSGPDRADQIHQLFWGFDIIVLVLAKMVCQLEILCMQFVDGLGPGSQDFLDFRSGFFVEFSHLFQSSVPVLLLIIG